ncbi:histidine kinase [bacterium]|nr:histidine kinase [bacterium]
MKKSFERRLFHEILMYLGISSASAFIFGSLYISNWTWKSYQFSFLVATVFYIVMRLLPGYAAPKIVSKIVPAGFKRSVKTVAIELGVFAMSGLLGTYIVLTIMTLISGKNFLGSARLVYTQLFIGLIITLLVSTSIYATIFYREMIHKMSEVQQAKELAIQSELKALRAQINPHFLFNTLNSISALIAVDPKKADRVTQKLADIFRYVLIASEKEEVTLEEELRFIENYLEIERVRFEDLLKIEKHITEESLTLFVPSLILQPIVENALKHGISKNINGGTLTLRSSLENGFLIVSVADDGDGFEREEKSDGLGIGLANVDQRLKKTYGQQFGVQIESDLPKGVNVRLTLPGKHRG